MTRQDDTAQSKEEAMLLRQQSKEQARLLRQQAKKFEDAMKGIESDLKRDLVLVRGVFEQVAGNAKYREMMDQEAEGILKVYHYSSSMIRILHKRAKLLELLSDASLDEERRKNISEALKDYNEVFSKERDREPEILACEVKRLQARAARFAAYEKEPKFTPDQKGRSKHQRTAAEAHKINIKFNESLMHRHIARILSKEKVQDLEGFVGKLKDSILLGMSQNFGPSLQSTAIPRTKREMASLMKGAISQQKREMGRVVAGYFNAPGSKTGFLKAAKARVDPSKEIDSIVEKLQKNNRPKFDDRISKTWLRVAVLQEALKAINEADAITQISLDQLQYKLANEQRDAEKEQMRVIKESCAAFESYEHLNGLLNQDGPIKSTQAFCKALSGSALPTMGSKQLQKQFFKYLSEHGEDMARTFKALEAGPPSCKLDSEKVMKAVSDLFIETLHEGHKQPAKQALMSAFEVLPEDDKGHLSQFCINISKMAEMERGATLGAKKNGFEAIAHLFKAATNKVLGYTEDDLVPLLVSRVSMFAVAIAVVALVVSPPPSPVGIGAACVLGAVGIAGGIGLFVAGICSIANRISDYKNKELDDIGIKISRVNSEFPSADELISCLKQVKERAYEPTISDGQTL